MNSPITFADLRADSNIPTRFIGCEFSTFVAATPAQERIVALAQRTAIAMIEQPTAGWSLVMCGGPGTGKTHIACAIANAVMRGGRSVKFGTVLAAIRHVKDTYRRNADQSEKDAIDDLLAPDLLILDEIGVQVGSEHEKMLLFEIINERYQWCHSTVLISNLDRLELAAYLGDRMMDRFNETGAVLAFTWPSFRGKTMKAAA